MKERRFLIPTASLVLLVMMPLPGCGGASPFGSGEKDVTVDSDAIANVVVWDPFEEQEITVTVNIGKDRNDNVELAVKHLQNEDHQEAIDTVFAMDPQRLDKSYNGHFIVAVASEHLGNWGEAVIHYKKANIIESTKAANDGRIRCEENLRLDSVG